MKRILLISSIIFLGIISIFYFANIFSFKSRIDSKIIQSKLNWLDIEIAKNEFQKISFQRDTILANPRDEAWFMTPNEKKTSIKAKFKSKDGKGKGKIKLAGHYTDHWENETISYRIKLSKGKFLGSTKFNILRPKTRCYLTDWFASQIAREIGLTTLHTEFIKVNINEQSFLYLFEEAYNQNLISRLGIKEGFFFREQKNDSNLLQLNYEDEKNINSIIKSEFSTLYRKLLSDSIKIDEITNLNEMAKYYALADLFQSDHQLYIFNSRYIYDDSLKKISPIGREYWLPFELNEIKLLIDKISLDKNYSYGIIPVKLFESKKFKELYFEELKKISSGDIVNIIEEQSRDFISNAKKLLWREVEWGEKLVDIELLRRNQQIILKELKKK